MSAATTKITGRDSDECVDESLMQSSIRWNTLMFNCSLENGLTWRKASCRLLAESSIFGNLLSLVLCWELISAREKKWFSNVNGVILKIIKWFTYLWQELEASENAFLNLMRRLPSLMSNQQYWWQRGKVRVPRRVQLTHLHLACRHKLCCRATWSAQDEPIEKEKKIIT